MIENNISWPPKLVLKRYRRAKHIKLWVKQPEIVHVTLPMRCSRREVDQLLEANKSWVMQQLLRYASSDHNHLPEYITLKAISEIWQVEYHQDEARLKLSEKSENKILLIGNTQNKDACRYVLLKWLMRKAKIYLTNEIYKISKYHALPFESISVRNQQTRWGSCSSKKRINLNYKLIFLPQHLMKHIIIHELCHTKYLNHSREFWALVADNDSDWRQNRNEMRDADKYIPPWLLIS